MFYDILFRSVVQVIHALEQILVAAGRLGISGRGRLVPGASLP
jgi:hypothetical protein